MPFHGRERYPWLRITKHYGAGRQQGYRGKKTTRR
jgi:hypothetical protein